MIRVDRTAVDEPASLEGKLGGRGRFKDMTESERVAIEFEEHLSAGGLPEDFTFNFTRYKGRDVKAALERLFHGKCAYCEARYAGTQPLDVEHWRPKAAVVELGANGKRETLAGYFWLAAKWDNLFPSCTDCNRERTQRDLVTGVEEVLGKANQFPVDGPRWPRPVAGAPAPPAENALLLNPCEDDPALHLDFHEDGTVLARPGSRVGAESIRVYALNRVELAMDRLGMSKLIEQRLFTIEALAAAVLRDDLSTEVERDLKDLLAHEIDALLELAEPHRPFSAMARQLIAEQAPDLDAGIP
jgi:uncharacterized protein (TIGR02646 family)